MGGCPDADFLSSVASRAGLLLLMITSFVSRMGRLHVTRPYIPQTHLGGLGEKQMIFKVGLLCQSAAIELKACLGS